MVYSYRHDGFASGGRLASCLNARCNRSSHRPSKKSALYGTRTRLTCSTGRPPLPLRHRAKSVRRESHPPIHHGKVAPRLLGHGHISRTEGFEPSRHALEAHCSPRSTSLTADPKLKQTPNRRGASFCLRASASEFRELESNQHRRVQSPLPYQLGDPGIDQLPERESNPHASRAPVSEAGASTNSATRQYPRRDSNPRSPA